jgi:hypothetical protein
MMASVRTFATKRDAEDFRTALANSRTLPEGTYDCWLFPVTEGWRVYIPDAGDGVANALQGGRTDIEDTEETVRGWLRSHVGDIDRAALVADGTVVKRD